MKTNQRQFKFRFWDAEGKKYFRPIDSPQYSIHCTQFSIFKDRKIITQQFTGLKDAKDKEIFEGDILIATDYSKGKVIYDSENAKFIVSYELQNPKPPVDNGSSFGDGNFGTTKASDFIVIGNIFENPELLKS